MPEKSFQVYGYRWVVLILYMLVSIAIQILWICFAPITGPATEYYGVSTLAIGMLAMSFMFVYLPVSMPASWLIDRLGLKVGVGIGAGLMALFAILRAVFAADFTWVVIATIGLGVAQPFIMNAVTTVASKWFPIEERATAGGLAVIANFMGIAIGQVLTPVLFLAYGMVTTQAIYAGVSVLTAVLFAIFSREAPPTPPCLPGQEERALVLDGLKSMLKLKDMWILLALFLVGMGVFNGISTWIEGIVSPRGFSIIQAGNLGGILLLGSVIGAAVIPLLSDRLHRRKIFLQMGILFGLPGLVGVTFAHNYGLMMVSMFWLGFSLMALAPIGYQYAAEITFPAPEGTSNGLLNFVGQASVVFIYGMEAFKSADGSFTPSLLVMVGMMVVALVLVSMLSESKLIRAVEPVAVD